MAPMPIVLPPDDPEAEDDDISDVPAVRAHALVCDGKLVKQGLDAFVADYICAKCGTPFLIHNASRRLNQPASRQSPKRDP
jgi:hypothetical protein